MAFDDFEEESRAIGDRLRENLQHVAFVVAVDEDAEFGEIVDVLLDLADALAAKLVIGPGTRRNETSLFRMARTVSTMSPVAMAMCCTPGPP